MGIWETVRAVFGSDKSGTEDKLLAEFQRRLGYRFSDPELLRVALTHRSVARPGDGTSRPSNERLEFLGDSVLGMVVSEWLYARYPGKSEGGLTKFKSLLVNETTLFRTMESLDLSRFVLLSQEEERAGGRNRASINADALEAVLGAVYLDGSLGAVKPIIETLILSQVDKIATDESFRNYKGELLEHLQARGAGMPRYEVTSEVGPDHDKIFTVEVHSNGEKIGVGTGLSKKDAEQGAAAEALKGLQGDGMPSIDGP